MSNLKEVFGYFLIVAIVIALVAFQVVYAPREAMYSCQIAEISPDYPSQVVQACRKANADVYKKEHQK